MTLESIDHLLELRAHEQLHDHRSAWRQNRSGERERRIDQLPQERFIARGDPSELPREVTGDEVRAPAEFTRDARRDGRIEDVADDCDCAGAPTPHPRHWAAHHT